jgi:8-oxo-dGTP diphosphatase
MKQITTVAGVIKNENGEILCTLRDQGKYDYVSFKWEFPGGKVEEGETNEQTLTRELHEELEIDVEIENFFYQVEHDYPDFHLSMAVFECKLISKEMKMNVHKGIKWLKPNDMMTLDWAAADIPVAELIVENAPFFA